MNSKRSTSALMVTLIVAVLITACGPSAPAATETPASTNTPVPTATNTPRPTITPKPTHTPDMVATQQFSDMYALVEVVFADGYLPSTKGRFTRLADFKVEMAQIGYYDTLETGKSADNFIFKAHFAWSNALINAELSGCGIAFREQQNGDHYFLYLDRDVVRGTFLNSSLGRAFSLSSIGGSQNVSYGNPAETDFALVAIDGFAYVYLDGAFKTKYALYSETFTLERGKILYAIKSGTNKDYGTRCEMTDVSLWEVAP